MDPDPKNIPSSPPFERTESRYDDPLLPHEIKQTRPSFIKEYHNKEPLQSRSDDPSTEGLLDILRKENPEPQRVHIPTGVTRIRLTIHDYPVASILDTLDALPYTPVPFTGNRLLASAAEKGTCITYGVSDDVKIEDPQVSFVLERSREDPGYLLFSGQADIKFGGLVRDENLPDEVVWCISISPWPELLRYFHRHPRP